MVVSDRVHGHNVYQASQYDTCDPVIRKLKLQEVSPAVVTAISTMYIPPKRRNPADPEMLRRLGLVKPKAAPTDHAPARGRTVATGESVADILFQSTPPRGGEHASYRRSMNK